MPKRLHRKIERQERILSILEDLTYATSEHLRGLINIGGDRNARRILQEIEKDGLIRSLRQLSKVYFLSGKGGDLIGKSNPRLNGAEIDHCLIRNDLRAELEYPNDWRNEVAIKINGETSLIADAVFTRGGWLHFVEVDNRATMATNYKKIDRYARLFERINKPAVLVFCTRIKSRRNLLRKHAEKCGINIRLDFP